jgi:hypothetical protein
VEVSVEPERCHRCQQPLAAAESTITLVGARYHVRCVRWSEFAQWIAGPPAQPDPPPEAS